MVYSKPNLLRVVTKFPDLCHSMQADSSSIQDMDWSRFLSEMGNMNPIGSGGSFEAYPTPISNSNPSHAVSNPSPSIPSPYLRIRNDDAEEDPPSAVERLARLNVALYECAKKLPSRDKAGGNSEGPASTDTSGSRKTRVFAIDEIFSLTNQFTEVMKSLVQCETNVTQSSIDTPEQLGTHPTLLFPAKSQPSHASHIVPSQPTQSFLQIDEATMSMIFSCHCRLAETYGIIFQLIQACIQYSFGLQLNKDWAIILPKLQVGSLISPPVHVDASMPLPWATMSIYMPMITLFSSQIWGQMAEIFKGDIDVRMGVGLEERTGLVNMMWDTVMDRTNSLLKSIDATNCLLKQSER